jgi:methylphosphotriester-DNA--protein-cysteine methyltransferase
VVRGLGPDLLAAGASLFELVHARADPLLVRGATLTLAGRLRAACAAGADPRATARDRVAPALALATRCPDGRVGLDTLARACGLGRSAFGETFRAGMGMAPRAWINRERARSAARALASGAMPARAAGEHGYPSARHLSRALIQFTGRGLRAWTDSAAGGSGP